MGWEPLFVLDLNRLGYKFGKGCFIIIEVKVENNVTPEKHYSPMARVVF